MKKIIFCIITLISIFTLSCKNEGGSIYAMEQRYKNFLNILPKEVKDDYILTSSKYSNEYKMWIDEFNTWASNTINKENEDLSSIKLGEPLIFYNNNKEIIPKIVQTEEEVTKAKNLSYFRIPVKN